MEDVTKNKLERGRVQMNLKPHQFGEWKQIFKPEVERSLQSMRHDQNKEEEFFGFRNLGFQQI